VLTPLASVDLNLLLALDAMLEEGNVTRAASRIGISQSAMSHALRRLRRQLGDPLFVRVGNAMRPTRQAKGLRVPVKEAVRQIERVLAPRPEFRPAVLERSFRILAGDAAQLLMIPALARRLAALAPKARLEIQDLSWSHFGERLASGDADLALCWAGDLEPSRAIAREPIFTDRHVCLVRADLEGVPDPLDWATYATLGHLVLLPRGTEYPLTRQIDNALERRGLARRRCVTLNSVLLVAEVLATSDYVATVTERAATLLCRSFPLRAVRPPFRTPRFEISALWDVRHGEDSAHGWLRGLIREIGAQLEAAAPAGGSSSDRSRSRLARRSR
jgi:DNA-binding transcriptional LysR family regulator